MQLHGPPKEPKIMAQYPKTESIGSIGSIILALLGLIRHLIFRGPKRGLGIWELQERHYFGPFGGPGIATLLLCNCLKSPYTAHLKPLVPLKGARYCPILALLEVQVHGAF